MEEFEEFEEEEEEEVEVPKRTNKAPLPVVRNNQGKFVAKPLRPVEKEPEEVVEEIKEVMSKPERQQEREVTTEEIVRAIQDLAQRITALEASNYRIKSSI